VRQLPEESPSKPALSRGLCLMRRAIEEGRDILHELRLSGNVSMNLEQGLSLEQALFLVHDEFALCRGIRFRIFVKGQSKELQPTIQEQIYLIGREALVNALRHSQATNIEGEVEYLPRRLRVVIRDNGCGIDPEVLRSGHWAWWECASGPQASVRNSGFGAGRGPVQRCKSPYAKISISPDKPASFQRKPTGDSTFNSSALSQPSAS